MLGYKLVSNFVLGIGRVQRGFWSKVANENLEKKKKKKKKSKDSRGNSFFGLKRVDSKQGINACI